MASQIFATAEPGRLFQDVLPWALAIVAFAAVGAVVIMFVRRLLRSGEGSEAPGFTLQSLRDLRDSGEITEEEYERARQAMIGQVKGSAGTPEPPADANESGSVETDAGKADSDKTSG